MKTKTANTMTALIMLVTFPVLAQAATVTVTTYAQLVSAVSAAAPGDTILLEDGIYQMTSNYWSVPVPAGKNGLVIRGKSGDRTTVVINGLGMHAAGHHGFWVAANNVTIRDLTIQNVRNHCIQTNTNVDSLTVLNCVLRDAGEQILKVPYSSSVPDSSENGLVQGCLFEYSAGVGPRYYIGGIDVHFGKNWIVRDNVFRFIRSPGGSLAEHAVHFWTNSQGTLVERNQIITCDRGIGFGLGASPHSGGIIRNNMIYHDGSPGFNDVGIGLENAAGVKVFNNTIFLESAYPNAVEYRFAGTTAAIQNNLTNKAIARRDGGSALLNTNVTNAVATWFTDPATADLHLAFMVTGVVDQGAGLAEVADDFDQQARPFGSAMDIGADEWGACSLDQDADNDVDGEDLAAFAQQYDDNCLNALAAAFGH